MSEPRDWRPGGFDRGPPRGPYPKGIAPRVRPLTTETLEEAAPRVTSTVGQPRTRVCGGALLDPAQSVSASKVRSRSAATLTAIVAGSLPVTSGSPIGVLIRSMTSSS